MQLPFGLWSSPVDSKIYAHPPLGLQEMQASGDYVYWTEVRPLEKGRHALMRASFDESPIELFPSMNIRTAVHEYGGGAFKIEQNGFVFFDAFSSSLYFECPGHKLLCLARDPTKRWADFSLSPDAKQVICVCEDHANPSLIKHFLVSIDCLTLEQRIVDEEHSFYASPRWSPEGEKIAFLSWDDPLMPWQECGLTVLYLSSGLRKRVGKEKEAIAQFLWTEEEEILYASDQKGFWNFFLWTPQGEQLFYEKKADFAAPLWVLGRNYFQLCRWKGKKAIFCTFCERAISYLGVIPFDTKELCVLDVPYTTIRTISAIQKTWAYLVAGSPKEPLAIVAIDLASLQEKVLAKSMTVPLTWKEYISFPQEVFTHSSLDGGKIYGFYYPPHNPLFKAGGKEKPPLLIKCHGGPTAHAEAHLNWEIQLWTTLGFGWLDVNYRGSSGFGKEYRNALFSKWGALDAQDCLDLALHLVEEGMSSLEGLFAVGSSSGGLAALAMAVSGYLRGCLVRYPVSDLIALQKQTHSFERHYVESLVGQDRQLLQKRSPQFYAGHIGCPVLLFHGKQDRVIPVCQTEELYQKLPDSEIILLEEEGHGFKSACSLSTCFQKEKEFCLKQLGLSLHSYL